MKKQEIHSEAHAILRELQAVFETAQNAERAGKMSAYMKDNFGFYGIMSTERRLLQRPFLQKEFLPDFAVAKELARLCFAHEKREVQYFAMELLGKYKNAWVAEDFAFFEGLIQTKSWWDSIDFISPNLVGNFFLNHTDLREELLPQWIENEDFWLRRSAIIHQLRYKEKTETDWLEKSILPNMASKEFFIRKAIGWALREYAKSRPEWVLDFVERHEPQLSGLSKREALKHLNKLP
ncbi:MAG: DNA alkylation repair protein [Weeksellaceae bacterium]|nr:DNA alkylation repair protein [Weeksellaceae bacterium]